MAFSRGYSLLGPSATETLSPEYLARQMSGTRELTFSEGYLYREHVRAATRIADTIGVPEIRAILLGRLRGGTLAVQEIAKSYAKGRVPRDGHDDANVLGAAVRP